MEKSTLKTLRLFTPGIIILLYGLLLFSESWDKFFQFEFDPSKLTLKSLVLLFSGILYYSLDLRALVWCRYFLPQVQSNIFNTLLEGGNYSLDQEVKIRDPKNLTLLFYSFIDNDASLTNKLKDVYANGYVASTLSDLVVVSISFVLIFFVSSLITQNWYYGSASAIAIIVAALGRICLTMVRRKHIRLSNDQMHYILQQYKGDLTQRINGLL